LWVSQYFCGKNIFTVKRVCWRWIPDVAYMIGLCYVCVLPAYTCLCVFTQWQASVHPHNEHSNTLTRYCQSAYKKTC
jgi:hypothetical protein